jgi:exodeoxyribonuclease V alpha subunit
MAETLKFKITPQTERFYSDDSSYGVYVFHTSDDIPEYDIVPENQFDDFPNDNLKMSILAGNMQHLYLGAEYEVTATMDYNTKYKSYQYKPITITAIAPKSEEQQRKFLSSLVTDKQCDTLLAAYPNIVEDMINGKDDVDLSILHGIGEFTYKNIKEKVLENYVISDILVLLQPLGVSFKMIKKLLMNEPNPVLLKQKLIDNPYIMTQFRGFGFKTVDQLALKLNPGLKLSAKRTYAFINYYFEEIGNSKGHTWVTKNALENAVIDNINECIDIYKQIIEEELEHERILHIDGDKIGLKRYYQTELNIYNILKDLNKYPKLELTEEQILQGIKEAEDEQGFPLTEEQRDTVIKALDDNVVLIVGKSGTGKTTISRTLLKIYSAANYSVSCCSLSAKAAQRIIEATGFQASTIHRLLGVSPEGGFEHDHNNPLESDVILADECSMNNASIYYSLVSAIQEGKKIIMCGDNMQLPPIGYGNVFSDLILKSDIIGVHRLTKVLRQAEKSGILSDANQIREGISPIKQPELKIITGKLQDMTYMFRDTREGLQNIAINTYLKAIEQDGMDEVIIITPRRNNCLNSAEEINIRLIDILLHDKNVKMKLGRKEYLIGSKVMQTENNYEKNVFNGEVGYITSISEAKQGKEKKIIFTVEYTMNGNTKTIEYSRNELDQLDLAYAVTVHKCITENTWLYTSNGLAQLKTFNNGANVLESKKIHNDIKVYNGKFMEKPSNFYNAGITPCKKITTQRNYELTATLDHKVNLIGSNGYIHAKAVKDLTENDYIIISKDMNIYGNNIELPQEWKIDKNDVYCNAAIYNSPSMLTFEFARFLGYMVADGVVGSCGIKYGKNHKNVVDDFNNIVNQIFGYSPYREPKNVLPDGKMGGMYLTEINSTFIRDYCRKIDGIQPNDKYVPDVILKAPKQYQIEFLKGIFEDGSVCIKNGKFDHISFTAKEEILVDQIRYMLLNIGIVSTKLFRNNDTGGSYTLFIYGSNCDLFIKEIGFISNEKMNKVFKYYDHKSKNETYSIPYISNIVMKIIEKYKLATSEIDKALYNTFRRNRITYSMLGRFINYCNENNINDNDVEYLKYIYNYTDVQQIKSLTDTTEHTYCLEMPITHQFVQNGISAWNCQGSEYQTVIIIIDMTHYTLLDTCLLYTAITRAKKRCLLLAEPKAYKMCIETNKSTTRQTWLKYF